MKKITLTIINLVMFLISQAGGDNTPLGARSTSMANASVTLCDVWSSQHNQAGLAFIHNVSGSMYYENTFSLKELSTKAGSVALPIRKGTFALLMCNFGYKLYSENKFKVSYAKAFGETFSMGIAMDYINVMIGEGYGRKDMIVGEMGIISKPIKNLTIGMHLYNPTRTKITNYNGERISTIFRLGSSYNFSNKVLFAIETEKDISYKSIFKAGLEYKLVKELTLRAGICSNPSLSSFGFGIHLKNFTVDISAHYNQVLGFSPQCGLTYVNNKKQNTNFSTN